MKFHPITQEITPSLLKDDFNASHQIGIVYLGNKFLFFKKGLKCFYVPFGDLTYAFRRVLLVPAKMCCASGNLEVEYLVLHTKDGEVAQLSIPGKKAAVLLLDELKQKSPSTKFECPKTPGQNQGSKK